ncbi:MAG: DUF5320 domain-containing protein [Peptococcaceae bacterium]
MARGDGTGPMGMGSMTGRRAGYCNGFAGGFGRRRGLAGCSVRRESLKGGAMGIPNPGAFDEKAFLSSQAELLESQLRQIKKQLSRLDEKTE